MQEDDSQEMDTLWGEEVIALRAENADRGQLFNDGNYAMFIHWGPYSQLANKVDGKTYYGIGEWILNPRMANIPVKEYMEMAKTFNPDNFDATEIAQLAKDAGMKHISRVHEWTPEGKTTWTINVLTPGDYNVDLTYSGEGRLVWGVTIEKDEHIQNQQNSSHNYQRFPIGWMNFPKPGTYKISVSCLEGDLSKASLKSIHFTPIHNIS